MKFVQRYFIMLQNDTDNTLQDMTGTLCLYGSGHWGEVGGGGLVTSV